MSNAYKSKPISFCKTEPKKMLGHKSPATFLRLAHVILGRHLDIYAPQRALTLSDGAADAINIFFHFLSG